MRMSHPGQSVCKVATLLAAVLLACSIVSSVAIAAEYLGPEAVATAKDGKTLFITQRDAKNVAFLDVASRKVTKTVAVPATPTGVTICPAGEKLFVTCAAPEGTVCVIDIKSGAISEKIPVGHTPIGPAVSSAGDRLFVCNRFNDNVSIIDLATGKEVAKAPVVREPIAAATVPNTTLCVVANHLPLDPADGYDVAAWVHIIDSATNQAKAIRLLNGSSGLRGVAVAPDGKYAYVSHILARYQMPTTQLERGWMNTNALSIIDLAKQELLNTVLLDDVDLGAAIPWGVAVTADGKKICVTISSGHELAIVDAVGMIEKVLSMPPPPKDDRYSYSSGTSAGVPNDLAFLVDLKKRIRLKGNGPRGVAVIGQKAYAVEYFSDSVAEIDLESDLRQPVTSIALGPAPKISTLRRGEILFSDADMCFQRWQSCTSCHPDARVDALNWDLLNDGLGTPKNVKSMLLAHDTPPAMSTGVRDSAEVAVRSGIRHIQFAVRPEEDAQAIDEYLKSLKPVPSPYLVNGQLSESAKRGQKVFSDVGCVKCHPAPLYTDKNKHNVGSKGQYDRTMSFDTPTLVECWRTAPYMHDGKYTTLKDLLTKGKHGGKHGEMDNLAPEQIDDLVEYVLSL
jgi:YVTN family beta-propeller protein